MPRNRENLGFLFQTQQQLSCEQKLDIAKDALRQYEKFVEEVQKGPNQQCLIIESHGDRRYTVALHGSMTQAILAPGSIESPAIGEMWWFNAGVLIDQVSDMLPPIGTFLNVVKINSDSKWTESPMVDVDAGGESRTVMANGFKIQPGDKVLLDPSGLSVQYVKPPTDEVKTTERPITWSDIGGLEDAKRALREAVELPHKFPHMFKAYGQVPTKGVLLLGPPGCGKTMLGKAVASSLAETHGKLTSDGFIYVKGPEVLSKWVGEAEAAIRALFARARKHKQKHGYDAVIFIDEADALLSARGTGIGNLSHTIVPQFLAEMDGLDESGAVMILATNRPHALDPAVTREGRIDRKVSVTRPSRETAQDILSIHTRGLKEGLFIASFVAEKLWSDEFPLLQLNTDEQPIRLHLRHTTSGAMLAGVIQRAKGFAIQRDIKSGLISSVTAEDLELALKEIHAETKLTRLDEVIREVAESTNSLVMSVTAL